METHSNYLSRSNSVPLPSSSPVDMSTSISSLFPVTIHPPRHNSLSVLPLSPVGKNNSSFCEVFAMSESWSSRMELDDESSWGRRGKTAGSSSLPGDSGKMMMMMKVGGGVESVKAVAKTPLTTVSVVVSSISENEVQSEGAGSTNPKQKLTRADRRAIQEAQRAAKAVLKEAGEGGKSLKQVKSVKAPPQNEELTRISALAASEKKASDRLPEKDRKKDASPPHMQNDDKHRVEKEKHRAIANHFEAMFRHLPHYVHGTQLPDLELKFFQLEPMHPSVYKVGLQYLSGDVSGSNARCIAMLLAFKEAINDYSTPSEKMFIRDLTAKISSYVSFFTKCRPLSISMGNGIKFLKSRIASLPDSLSESERKSSLCSDIDRFVNEKIILADKVIVGHAITKIRDGDVLLTYGSSTIVEMILLRAHDLGKLFQVVVVDSRPKLEAQTLLGRLIAKGLSCTYTHINALSYIMHEVTQVFLGAASVLSNGTVYSRVGTACVAMVAHAFRVPVFICCEAYKFHERAQLDSICSNELGDPDVISKAPGGQNMKHLDNWAEDENLQLLNLSYDATPSDYVSMIITDYGMLPPASVPLILREYRREHVWI